MRHRFEHSVDYAARTILAPRAREMRISPTQSEALLWSAIRGSKLGVRFRRQVVLGDFIVDFFAPSARLVVEVDGEVHEARQRADSHRDTTLAADGLRVLRLSRLLIECDLDAAVARIRDALAT